MRPMRRLTDKNRIIKISLQSLPAVLAAIAILLYGLTFLPVSQRGMERSVALVEHVSRYEITAGGKPVAWFRAFGDSLSLDGVTASAAQVSAECRLITGVWVNRYSFMPSCRGRILIPALDTAAGKTLSAANKDVAFVIQRALADNERLLSRLERTQAKLRYYLDTHNVSDEGYNTMAAYAAAVDSSRHDAERLDSVLKGLDSKAQVGIRHIEQYTLLYSGDGWKTSRKVCRDVTKDGARQFRIVQTEDQTLPADAEALYFHRWLLPSVKPGAEVITAAYHGSSQSGFSTEKLRAGRFHGMIATDGGHDVPPLFAPDGSPVFTKGGRLMGITIGGKVCQAKSFSFGFNDLLP